MRFGDLPFIVKFAIGLTFYNSWVIFEETVVDRHGLSQFLPFYEVGCFCVWDVAAILLILGFLTYWSRRQPRKKRTIDANTN